ncbi:hypothetical protein GDO86_003097 [Hymenochirus boettgeri]|uniref:Myeloperoxidase n=1 Tax=Hymenochirus boettgeri TaxID=247094 RepID=A0A8T2K2R4_9PIPI|nr:hypothetical protein GDO86_003097 [Hymenochirus boettgeri]
MVDTAYEKTRLILKQRLKRQKASPVDLLAYLKQPGANCRDAVKAADYMDITFHLLYHNVKNLFERPFNISDLLTESQMHSISTETGCTNQHHFTCHNSPYRTITGHCNNRKNPSLGASNTKFTRLLPAQYEDGLSLPRGWTENRPINGFPLPLARAVSNEIVSFPNENLILDEHRSQLFVHWGQWMDHDLDDTPDTPAKSTFVEGIDCETSCAKEPPCFPLRIPPNDPRIKNESDCIPFARSSPACNPRSPVREQMNGITSYIDGNQVYGSDSTLATQLRNRTNHLGLLAINKNFTDNGLAFLPFDTMNGDVCTITNSPGIPCFLAGDSRVSQQPGLMVLHTLFLRAHNTIAKKLHRLNPSWSGETLYLETRKIVGGIFQKITYKDWLPLLLGSEMPEVLPSYRSYEESVDPRVANVFTIAFRMGHTLIDPFVYRLAEDYRPLNPEPIVPLHKTFFNTWMLVNGGYNAWRRFCGLFAPRNVMELALVLNNRPLAEKFIKLYGTPENIDLWIGGVAEPRVHNGRIGKLLTCLIGNQFRRTRDGDRFFYEQPSVFSDAQRASIKKVTLARIICDNTKIMEVPKNVFLGNHYPRDFVRCSKIPKLDLNPWKVTKPRDGDSKDWTVGGEREERAKERREREAASVEVEEEMEEESRGAWE